MKKSLIYLSILSASISLASCQGKSQDKIYGEEKELVTSIHPMTGLSGDVTYKYRYSDDYFLSSSLKMDKNLALLSFISTMSAKDIETASNFATLNGFTMDASSLGEGDTIGYYLSHRDTDEYTIINYQLKGYFYGNEQMLENFMIGASGFHHNFDYVKEIVYSRLITYIKEMSFTKPLKIWINGYSRSGAIANLLVKKINDLIDDKILPYKKSDVFVYNFEIPKNKPLEERNDVKNCFNFINDEDLITHVPPSQYGFDLYGKTMDIYQENALDDISSFFPSLRKIVFTERIYTKDSTGSYMVKEGGLTKMSEYFDYVCSQLLKVNTEGGYDLATREHYHNYLEIHLYDLYDFFTSLNAKQLQNLSNISSSKLLEIFERVKDDKEKFYNYIKEFFNDAGITIYDDPFKDIIADLQGLLAFFGKSKFTMFNIAATFISNVNYVCYNHCPEYNYWLLKKALNI